MFILLFVCLVLVLFLSFSVFLFSSFWYFPFFLSSIFRSFIVIVVNDNKKKQAEGLRERQRIMEEVERMKASEEALEAHRRQVSGTLSLELFFSLCCSVLSLHFVYLFSILFVFVVVAVCITFWALLFFGGRIDLSDK